MTLPRPIQWTGTGTVRLLDQTALPDDERYRDITTVAAMREAIAALRVRGAPLIGIAAAIAVTLTEAGAGAGPTLEDVRAACSELDAARPTAVNLRWALDRMRHRAEVAVAADDPMAPALRAEAQAIWDEDRAMCERIGEAGAELLGDGDVVLTHCNAGALATGGIGTALAPVYVAQRSGRHIRVIVDETRPLLQGSRLTAWELGRAGVAYTVIADGMAAARLRRGDVRCVLVGADRIAANGDVANKIGTYGLALAARAHGVPFYVAAPRSSVDLAAPDGAAIPIEQRAAGEVRGFRGAASTPSGAEVWNPAFDVTPAELVTGYLTDGGLLTARELGGLAPLSELAVR
jgi:methylthioribose-1-phosphate isomerase